MSAKINREKIKAFVLRRKANALGLLAITAFSILATIFCALAGFARTKLLVIVTALLIVLCFVQEIKLRSSFRTMHASFKAHRPKKRAQGDGIADTE